LLGLSIQLIGKHGESLRKKRKFFIKVNFTDFIAVPLLKEMIKVFMPRNEFGDARIFANGKADVVNSPSGKYACRVFNEENCRFAAWLFRNVEQLAFGALPNGMKLRFDEDAGPFPEKPTVNDGTAILGNVALDVVKAIAEAGVIAFKHGDKLRFPSKSEPTTELMNVGSDTGWSCRGGHGFKTPNV
jgi:hypothetical protein